MTEGSPTPMNYSSGGNPGDYQGPPPDKDSTNMAMLCHLLAIFTGFLGPLIIWLIKKEQSPFVDHQGKESLNFQLTILIAYIAAGALSCLVIGFFLIPVIMIVHIVFCIMAAIAANKGIAYRYPISIRMIK